MQLSIDTSSYNDRRYGKPWIARVDFRAGAKGHLAFGEWCGQGGSEGTLYLDVDPGDVVAQGQKDYRKPRNSCPEFFIVGPGGELTECSKADAYKHWRNRQANDSTPNPLADYTTEDLRAELARRGECDD